MVRLEKVPIYGNLKYTFLIVVNSVFIAFGSVLNFKKLIHLVIFNKNSVHVFLQNIFDFVNLVMKYDIRAAGA